MTSINTPRLYNSFSEKNGRVDTLIDQVFLCPSYATGSPELFLSKRPALG
jgi:hypothetical protein